MSDDNKNPVTGGADKQVTGQGQVHPGLVAEPAEPEGSSPALSLVQPDGGGVQLRGGIQKTRHVGREEGSAGADDRLAGLVAGGLRPLRALVHSHGMAQRRDVPHR